MNIAPVASLFFRDSTDLLKTCESTPEVKSRLECISRFLKVLTGRERNLTSETMKVPSIRTTKYKKYTPPRPRERE